LLLPLFIKRLLYFNNVLYLHFFFRFMRRLHVNGESWDFILFDKTLANPNYIPVYMKVNYLYTLCLFKVGRLFCKLAIPKYSCVFVI
jgi:hypothetical protein